MDTGERLAAYLSGDLEPDERTALEAQLARDAALRARLERIRAADRALVELGEVDLPDGFDDRLQARLAPALDAVLGDELAARRARRHVPRWLPAVGGAAAVLALVVAGGIAVVGVGGSDDAGVDTMAADGDSGEAEGLEEDAAAGSTADAFDTMQAPTAGPVVTDRGRTLTSEDLAELARDPDVEVARTSDLVQSDPVAASRSYAAALGGADLAQERSGDDGGAAGEAQTETETAAEAEAEAGTEDSTGSTPADRGPAVVSTGPGVTDDDLDAVTACLPVLFEDAANPVVPLYAELAEAEDGTDVIVYVALSPDADGEYRRLETWMVGRDSCSPRLFVQSDVQPVDRNAP